MEKSLRRSFFTVAMVGTLLASASDVQASLTLGETSQVRQFVTSAQLANAPRLRALVARPDLSVDESAAALSDALASQVFNDTRASFLHELVFGGASRASRSVLALAATRAVLARADALYTLSAEDLDKHPAAAAELQGIYAFLSSDLATPGQRRGLGADPLTGIALTTYDDCVRAIAGHIDKHPKLLRTGVPVSATVSKVRAQVQLALADFVNDSPTYRIDVADRLALTGARRSFFTESGVLVLDAGKASDGHIESVRRLWSRLPGARTDAHAIYFGDANPGLRARSSVLAVKTPLEAKKVELFGADVEAGPIDSAIADFAGALANVAVRRALSNRAELRAQTERDVRQVRGDAKKLIGNVNEPSAELALTSAVQLLLIDAQRTVDSVSSRFLSGSPESSAVLADAVAVLVAASPNAPTPTGLAIPVGKYDAATGTTETTFATAVRLGPSGLGVTGFTLSGRKWDFSRGDSGVVTAIQCDGTAVNATALSTLRKPGVAGTSAIVATSRQALEDKPTTKVDTTAAVGAKSEKAPR
ncbi:hypothetical protein LZC95_06790 [Pendulispora brunnea]|uniref:Uncharacterized protein n=1 Tax=Pendulispora brunnea TaxID=2905690 RepID=A0ABZ2KHK8_9BACT